MSPSTLLVAAPRGGPRDTPSSGPVDMPIYSRSTHVFSSAGEQLEAWLYVPKTSGAARPPVVLMAHGMGAQKDMGLDTYASAFAKGGLAAFVFDYRSFGGSSGSPRQWVSPSRHVEDWHAAVAHVQSQLGSRVDTSRLCLWGTSFAGGHVLAIAAATPGVTAVVSQVPHLDARAATLLSIKQRGIPKSLAMVGLGALDLLRTALGLPPLYLPLVGPPGSLAFMQLNEFETSEYFSKHPSDGVYQGGWVNAARAALAFELFSRRYSPIQHVAAVRCPILFVAATQDVLCPVEQVRRAVALARRGSLLSRECTHFELYRGQLFEGLIGEQLAFLQQHTGLVGVPAAKAKAADAEDGDADTARQRDQAA